MGRYSFQFGALNILLLLDVAGSRASGQALVHRWLGHSLVLVAWFTVPISGGVVLQQGFMRRPWASIACVLVALFACGFCVLSSLTGYLAPPDPERHPETLLRFKTFHLVVFPSMTGMLLGVWFVALMRFFQRVCVEGACDRDFIHGANP